MKRLVVLTGAGMSAESGISTFRDSGGLWEQYRIEDVATPEAWRVNPELVQHFYNQRRKQLAEAQPNEGHRILAGLENYFDVRIVTQNVDNLHERAGSTHVLHLHGELMKMRSTGPGAEVFDAVKTAYSLTDTCPKGYVLRPHIVWFGEDVPLYGEAVDLVKTADILVVVGTSLQVYPAAGLLYYSPQETPVYLIDPNEVPVNRRDVCFIEKGASEGLQILKEMLVEGVVC